MPYKCVRAGNFPCWWKELKSPKYIGDQMRKFHGKCQNLLYSSIAHTWNLLLLSKNTFKGPAASKQAKSFRTPVMEQIFIITENCVQSENKVHGIKLYRYKLSWCFLLSYIINKPENPFQSYDLATNFKC